MGLGIAFDSDFQEKVAQVTPEDIQRIAQKYLQEPYLSLVGPANVVQQYRGQS